MVDKTLCECVFCGRTLEPNEAMFGWWKDYEAGGVIVAAGLYCLGLGECLDRATEGPRLLLDVHAETLPREIRRILLQYPNWTGEAARKAALTALAMNEDGEWL